MAYKPPYTSTLSIEGPCVEIGELVCRVSPSVPLSSNVRLRRELRIATIYSSLAIDCNTLTPNQTTAVPKGKPVLGPSADILAVVNADRAYELIGSLNPYSEDELLKAHAVMMQGLTNDAHRLRTRNVGVFAGE